MEMEDKSKPTPAQRALRSVGLPELPWLLKWVEESGPNVGHFLGDLAVETLASSLWSTWFSEYYYRRSPVFCHEFAELIADCLSMGLNVEHLRRVARSLPDPGPQRSNWVNFFEEAIAGKDKCRLRIILNPDYHHDCVESRAAVSGDSWHELLSMMTDGLFYELGIIYPQIAVSEDATLGPRDFRVEWNDLELPPRMGLTKDMVFVNRVPSQLRQQGLEAVDAVNPANGNAGALVALADHALCKQLGMTTWTWMGYMILEISSILRRASPAFVNRYFVEHCLSNLAQAFPALIQQVRKRFEYDVLVQIMRRLLSEEISVRDMSLVLESVLRAEIAFDVSEGMRIIAVHPASPPRHRTPGSSGRPTVADYVEYVRGSMRSYISHKYTSGSNQLNVYRLAPAAEARLQQFRGLAPQEAQELLRAARVE